MTPDRLKQIKERRETATKLSDPCKHPGCHNHLTHPCEGCGRQGGFASWETLLNITRTDLSDCIAEIKQLQKRIGEIGIERDVALGELASGTE